MKQDREKARERERAERTFILNEGRKKLDTSNMIPLPGEVSHTISPDGQLYRDEALSQKLEAQAVRDAKAELEKHQRGIALLRKVDELEHIIKGEELRPYEEWFSDLVKNKKEKQYDM